MKSDFKNTGNKDSIFIRKWKKPICCEKSEKERHREEQKI